MMARMIIRLAATNRGAGIFAKLSHHSLFSRTARAALGDQQTCRQRDDERRNLRDEAVTHRQFRKDIGCFGHRHAVAGGAYDNAAENIHCRNDETGNGNPRGPNLDAPSMAPKKELSSSSSLRRACAALSSIETGIEVGVNGHSACREWHQALKRAPTSAIRVAAFGDHQKVHDHQDREDDKADNKVTAHHKLREAVDDIARSVEPPCAPATRSSVSLRY